MKIEIIKIADLKFAEYNPRFMSDAIKKQLKKSIEKNGFLQPIIVNCHPDRKNIIIGGHQRVEIAKEMGWTEVPAVFHSKTLREEKVANLALNKIDGNWEKEKLGPMIFELKGTDMSMATGFSDVEQSQILDGMMSPFELDSGVEPPEPKVPASKIGEVYELGNHRLICGDSTKPETFEKLLQGEKINMIFTDPPYNVNYHSRGGGLKMRAKKI